MRGALGESRQKTNTGLVVFASRIRAPVGSTSRRTTICLPWKKTGDATSASGVVARRVEDWAASVVLRVPKVLRALVLKVPKVLKALSSVSTVSTCTVSTPGTVSTRAR